MRLLNAHTLMIHTFFKDIPPYAILSHVWGPEEVLYQDFQSGNAASLKGYTKILGCCKQAIADSLEYVWIDTCCIDKGSSSELQEAINSMFNFYRDAAVCYAYLEDVRSTDIFLALGNSMAHRQVMLLDSDFGRSRWFTRGWTLQELLAPSLLEFYAADWTLIGTRDDLRTTVAIITKIDKEFFVYGKFSDYSIAQKFSWASGRQTTRVEDEAYCLLGLFGISIPLLYGEGKRAFRRLQEELMRVSDDQSIFAWSSTDKGSSRSPRGLFASSPAAFAGSKDVVRGVSDYSSPPYSITNMGISICLPLIAPDSGYAIPFGGTTGGRSQISIAVTPTGSLAVLNCHSRQSVNTRLAIVIEQTGDDICYSRTNPSLELLIIPLADIKAIARQESVLIQAHDVDNEGVGWINQRQSQLVLLTNLPSASIGTRLKEHSSKTVCHSHTDGTVSFRLPGKVLPSEHEVNSRYGVCIEFEHEGRTFSVIIASIWTQSGEVLSAHIRASNLKREEGLKHANTRRSPEPQAMSSVVSVTVPLPTKQLKHAFKIIMPEWDVLMNDMKLTGSSRRVLTKEENNAMEV